MRKKVELMMGILLLLSAFFVGSAIGAAASADKDRNEKKLVILDPGHGGFDAGKIGVNKLLEKELNLQIAGKVKRKLEKKQVQVLMTREEDAGLYDADSANKKMEDMRRRVEMIQKETPRLVVSIHQNSFPDSSVKGAQVFYYTRSPEAKEAAKIMQRSLLEVDETNHRKEKGNQTYYMLKKTEAPTIIVECGFLSNWEEAELLGKEAYQEKLADAIVRGVLRYIEK